MAANKVADIFDETVDEVVSKRRSIFDIPKSEQNSPNSTTPNNPEIKFSEATTVPIYPVEYIEKIVKENDQWKKLWKDSIFEARRVKAHIAERKAVILQDSSFQKEVSKLDALEANFKDYLTKAQHFCNQKIVEKRMNE
nr:unnamed protein product [Callosobruchus chinensis]CAH7763321.1 unnamed protein product [Callosobruchus chinensis]